MDAFGVKITDMFKFFSDIFTGLWTVVTGMKVTGKYLIKKPVTVQYPEQKCVIPDRYRGILMCDTDKCIACMQCVNICPVSCISIDSVKVEGQKKKQINKFVIDVNRCIFCGLCVEVCPASAIQFTKDYEHSVTDRKELILHFEKPVAAGAQAVPAVQEPPKPAEEPKTQEAK